MSQANQHDTQAQTEIIETFEMFDDWLEKYQYIIDLGKQLPAMDEAHKVEENLLQGCQSQVWLIHEFRDGQLHFQANSDAAIVSGLIALVMTIYNDRSPSYITEVEPDFIEKNLEETVERKSLGRWSVPEFVTSIDGDKVLIKW